MIGWANVFFLNLNTIRLYPTILKSYYPSSDKEHIQEQFKKAIIPNASSKVTFLDKTLENAI